MTIRGYLGAQQLHSRYMSSCITQPREPREKSLTIAQVLQGKRKEKAYLSY